jgi:hypothetical protein
MSDFDLPDDDDDPLDEYDPFAEEDDVLPISAQTSPPEVSAPEPADELEILPGSVVTTPTLSLEDQIANAARAPTGPSSTPVPAYSQERLLQIAQSDPERYAALKEEGHSLEKLRWGPDRG